MTELLMTLTVLAILATLVATAVSRASRRGYRASCASNLRQLFQWHVMVADEESGTATVPASISRCPADRTTEDRASYLLRFGAPVDWSWVSCDYEVVHEAGRNTGWPDGSVIWQKAALFQPLASSRKITGVH